jgi:hypothetical protein
VPSIPPADRTIVVADGRIAALRSHYGGPFYCA